MATDLASLMATDYSVSGNNPIYPVNWSGIFSNLPKANIGMVPVGMGEKYGMDRPEMEYANPTNWQAKQVMHPDEWWKKEPIEINTELKMTPYNKFFPYEEDYSGIMSAKALQEQGGNIYDISKTKPDLMGVHMPYYQEVGLNLENLGRDPKNIQSTLFHEAKHYYLNKYGIDITELPTNRQHELIEQADDMFYGKYKGQYSPLLDKYAANLFMKMHKRGKERSQDPQPFEKGKISPEREQTIQTEKLKEEKKRVMDKLIRQGAAESMKQAGVDLSGGQIRQNEREDRQQQRETAKYRDTARTGAKAGYTYGLQEGGLVAINHITRRL
tara:strand:+ start:52 stop:1035 length:984 start_codon:yes stop_codon:yes gene_type:complete